MGAGRHRRRGRALDGHAVSPSRRCDLGRAAMIQVVCVRWGEKYGAEAVNRLYRAVRRSTSLPLRFVCITDRQDSDLDQGIVTRPFPPFALPFAEMTRGCRLKLAIFARGILEEGLPTVFFDLDTLVRGDVARITAQLERRPGLYLLPNHHIRFWRIQKYLRRVGFKKYYFGNSSILAFYPEATWFLFDDLNRLLPKTNPPLPKALQSDERFMSWRGRELVRVFPRRLAVKFAEEYMLPLLFLEDLRRRLPWVAARRRGLVAVTFVGDDFKAERLAGVRDGAVLRYRRLRFRWPHAEYRDYWLDAGQDSPPAVSPASAIAGEMRPARDSGSMRQVPREG